MTMVDLEIPALTPELEFILTHSDDAEKVIKAPEQYTAQLGHYVGPALNKVYRRAYEDLRDFILTVGTGLANEIQRHVHVTKWSQRDIENNWGTWAYLFPAKNSTRNIGWVDISLDVHDRSIRLVLSVVPGGGVSGCRQLVEECRCKYQGEPLLIPKLDSKNWPGWRPYQASVAYHIDEVDNSKNLEAVIKNAVVSSRKFFSVATPVMRQLAGM